MIQALFYTHTHTHTNPIRVVFLTSIFFFPFHGDEKILPIKLKASDAGSLLLKTACIKCAKTVPKLSKNCATTVPRMCLFCASKFAYAPKLCIHQGINFVPKHHVTLAYTSSVRKVNSRDLIGLAAMVQYNNYTPIIIMDYYTMSYM